MSKKFLKADYKKFDPYAKLAGMQICLDSGRYLMEEKGKTYDFIMQRLEDGSMKDVKFEVAVKDIWEGTMGLWPVNWKTVHMKASRIISEADYFIAMSKGYNMAWIVPMIEAKKAPIVTVPNKKVPHGEKFYDIPVEWGKFWHKPVGSNKWGPLNG